MNNRRSTRIAVLAGIAAILPVAVWSQSTGAAVVPATERFSAPPTALTLVRTLHRALSGGREVLTVRTYDLRISTVEDGFRVDGQQIDCSVEAPPMLQALADVERKRIDNGMFPIMLNANGVITSFGIGVDAGAKQQAADMVDGMIGKSRLEVGDKTEASGFTSQIRGGDDTISKWPLDLFNLRTGRHSETRRMALPDGSEGQVTIAMESHQSGINQQQDTVERIVTTDLGGSQRITREEWKLSRLDR